jgi:hypothetical protein
MQVRSGGGCSCVDIMLTGLSKEKCDYIKTNANSEFRAKSNWCGSGYNVNANHSGSGGTGTCNNNSDNVIRMYYKKW